MRYSWKLAPCLALALGLAASSFAQTCLWTVYSEFGDAGLDTCATTVSGLVADYVSTNPSDVIIILDTQEYGLGVQGTNFWVAAYACSSYGICPNPTDAGRYADAGGSVYTPLTQLCANSALVTELGAQAACQASSVGPPPQGRLTLTSNTPVMTGDATGATSVYYAPYVGNQIPIYGGCCSAFSNYTFGQLTMALNTSNQTSGNIYDLFVFLNSETGAVTIGAGPAWSSSTSRGTGTGSTQLTQLDGLWVNANDITLTNGSSTYGDIPADEATYVGSVYMTANGETTVNLKPSPAGGGTANVVGIWNAYNSVPISSLCSDSNTSWTDASTSWQPLDYPAGSGGGTYNRVTYLDGLGQSSVKGTVTTIAYNATAGDGDFIGIDQDSTTNSPIVFASNQSHSAGSAVGATSFAATESFPPNQGLHYLQAMEWSPNGTTATFGFNGSSTFLLYRGEY